ncbi:Glyoxalase-like domain protein [Maioricimonas rarisocia]|uniref:Glyoxalase-like domain protein n=1 Tax=Maioricimonas rarisocia TaxID=2528026 RepID=A0A517Z996_9PLAN|nr:VOC family protein [Maioricimonas rarisocia]QDU39057.1 Glyoxalase-like domain protein [Maioricimonas rarisocia]
MPVNPIPEGYTAATPYLVVRGCAAAIDFYKRAFDAREIMRLTLPDGTIGHAEIRIGDAPIMLADEVPNMGYLGPQSLGGSPVAIVLYVENVDAQCAQAEREGATMLKPVVDEFYGDRSGTLTDPFGHIWTFSTRIENLTPDEMQQRFDQALNRPDDED